MSWTVSSESSSAPPSDLDLIGPEPLIDLGIGDIHPDAGSEHLRAEPCDHRPVVHAESPVGTVHLRAAGLGHLPDHLPETHVLGYASPEKDLVLPYVGHCPLGDLREHGIGSLLDGQRYVLQGHALPLEGEGRGHQT